MTGLSVGFAFKTGLFNIGAAGQYTLGAYGALYCAIKMCIRDRVITRPVPVRAMVIL